MVALKVRTDGSEAPGIIIVDETAKEGIINELDENEFCQNLMKTLLKKYYKYEEKVIFEIDKEAEAGFA